MRLRSALFSELATDMLRVADDIEDLISGLDEDYPTWRRMPEAK
jgi:hypothetical protein